MSLNKVLRLTPEPLTPEAFSDFGDVIQVGEQPILINEGTTERHHKLSTVELLGQSDQAIINIFRAQPRSLPMDIKMMERHPLGSQAFLPTSSRPYLVLVCLGEDKPDPYTMRLFLISGREPSLTGVSYKASCWHHPLLALEDVTDFWVVDRAGEGNNLEEYEFDSAWHIQIPELKNYEL